MNIHERGSHYPAPHPIRSSRIHVVHDKFARMQWTITSTTESACWPTMRMRRYSKLITKPPRLSIGLLQQCCNNKKSIIPLPANEAQPWEGSHNILKIDPRNHYGPCVYVYSLLDAPRISNRALCVLGKVQVARLSASAVRNKCVTSDHQTRRYICDPNLVNTHQAIGWKVSGKQCFES